MGSSALAHMKKNTNGSPIRLYYVTQVGRAKGRFVSFSTNLYEGRAIA